MSSIILSAGNYTVELGPAATVSGTFREFLNDGPYQITVTYSQMAVEVFEQPSGNVFYQINVDTRSKLESFSTRPTVDDGTLAEFPRFT